MELAIIGIDGLDPRLVRSWKEDLSTLSTCIEFGAFGEVQSSYPPLTCPAWPTLITGKQGGKHGVYGFKKPGDASHRWQPVNYADIRAESLWEILDRQGLSVGVVNVPFTYPPSELKNGFIISGWPIPNRVEPGYPKSVLRELEDDLDTGYQVNPFPMQPEYEDLAPVERRERIVEGMWHHNDAFTTLVGQNNLDVFFAVYMAMDHAGHFLAWDRDELYEAYREQDQALGELLEEIPGETNVIIVSDHGHGGKSQHSFWINDWLQEDGFQARQKSTGQRRREIFRRVGFTRENAIRVKNAVGINDIRQLLPQRVFGYLKKYIPANEEETMGFDPSGINWEKTEAFAPLANMVFLNDDRFGEVIPSDEAEGKRREIASSLNSVQHPDGDRDEALITELRSKEELFEGPYIRSAPDLVFIADEMEVNTPTALGDNVFTPEQFGEHHPIATLVTMGPAFSETSEECDRVDITDVFPLACAVLGVSAPRDIDGELPEDRVEDGVTLERGENHDEYTHPEARQETFDGVEEQLRGLGYLE